MNYDFKKFENRRGRFEDRIAITKSYSIGFPTQFCEENNIGAYQYAILYWDSKTTAIGIEFNNISDKNSFSVAHSKQGYGASIGAKSFFKHNDINPLQYYGKYEAKKVNYDNKNIFVVELKTREDWVHF